MDETRENRLYQFQIAQSSLLSTANNASSQWIAEGESSANRNVAHRSSHVHVADKSVPPVALPKYFNLYDRLDNLCHMSQNYARQIANLEAQKSIIDKKIVDIEESLSEGSASSED